MRIGEVSRRTGIPASTLRYYEQIGLIDPPQRVGGQRDYNESILDTLKLIRVAKEQAFSLEEIQTLLQADQPQSDQWRDIAQQKLSVVQAQIAQFRILEATLIESINCDCIDLTTCDLIA